MAIYTLVFSNGKSAVIGDSALDWIRSHGAKGVLRIVHIYDEEGNDLLETDPKLKYMVFR